MQATLSEDKRKRRTPVVRKYEQSILESVRKYVNHRDYLYRMPWSGTMVTPEKLRAVDEVKLKLEQLAFCPIKVVARELLSLEPKLRLIQPGQTSKYRRSAMESIEQVMTYCRSILAPSFPLYYKTPNSEIFICVESPKHITAIRLFERAGRSLWRFSEQEINEADMELIQTRYITIDKKEYLEKMKKVIDASLRLIQQYKKLNT